MVWLAWPVFMNAINSGEMSGNAGGLIRWPARLMIPIGFFLLALQAVSELIKRVAVMQGLIPDPHEKQDAALPIKPVDTVGAGDTFCGYLAAGLDAGLDLASAMQRAAVAASLACLKPGAQPAIPRAEEVDQAMR